MKLKTPIIIAALLISFALGMAASASLISRPIHVEPRLMSDNNTVTVTGDNNTVAAGRDNAVTAEDEGEAETPQYRQKLSLWFILWMTVAFAGVFVLLASQPTSKQKERVLNRF